MIPKKKNKNKDKAAPQFLSSVTLSVVALHNTTTMNLPKLQSWCAVGLFTLTRNGNITLR